MLRINCFVLAVCSFNCLGLCSWLFALRWVFLWIDVFSVDFVICMFAVSHSCSLFVYLFVVRCICCLGMVLCLLLVCLV